jgi:hypothetical protein
MPKPLKNSRFGVYECSIAGGLVTKGNYRYGNYGGVINWDEFIYKIIPDIKQNDRLRDCQFPVLITSWTLRGSDPSRGPLGISRRSFPQPPRRKIPETELWEAVIEVIDHSWRVTKVAGQRLVGASYIIKRNLKSS